jgi:hypothetical protein
LISLFINERLLLAALAHQKKDPETASGHLRKAIERFRRLGVTKYIAHAETMARDCGLTLD